MAKADVLEGLHRNSKQSARQRPADLYCGRETNRSRASDSPAPGEGVRAAALWWAEALLAKQEAYTTGETVHTPARQWRLLKRRAPTGLYWLLQQVSAWPRRYVNQQWMDLGSILSLYH